MEWEHTEGPREGRPGSPGGWRPRATEKPLAPCGFQGPAGARASSLAYLGDWGRGGAGVWRASPLGTGAWASPGLPAAVLETDSPGDLGLGEAASTPSQNSCCLLEGLGRQSGEGALRVPAGPESGWAQAMLLVQAGGGRGASHGCRAGSVQHARAGTCGEGRQQHEQNPRGPGKTPLGDPTQGCPLCGPWPDTVHPGCLPAGPLPSLDPSGGRRRAGASLYPLRPDTPCPSPAQKAHRLSDSVGCHLLQEACPATPRWFGALSAPTRGPLLSC